MEGSRCYAVISRRESHHFHAHLLSWCQEPQVRWAQKVKKDPMIMIDCQNLIALAPVLISTFAATRQLHVTLQDMVPIKRDWAAEWRSEQPIAVAVGSANAQIRLSDPTCRTLPGSGGPRIPLQVLHGVDEVVKDWARSNRRIWSAILPFPQGPHKDGLDQLQVAEAVANVPDCRPHGRLEPSSQQRTPTLALTAFPARSSSHRNPWGYRKWNRLSAVSQSSVWWCRRGSSCGRTEGRSRRALAKEMQTYERSPHVFEQLRILPLPAYVGS